MTGHAPTGAGPEVSVDLLIIGAGPTGLYGAYYAGFRGLSVAVADALPAVGGQIAALYPEKLIYDVAGFPAVRGQDLVDRLAEQAWRWNPTYLLGHGVTRLDDTGEGIVATTDAGARVTAGAVLVCGGIGNFIPRELPVGSEYLGRGLRYFVPRLHELAGQDVVVVGGGDSALDWALSLEPIASSVTLVHRRTRFRAHERSVEQVHASSVRVLTPYEVEKVSGEGAVSEVVVASSDGDRIILPAQSVVAALGFIADLGPIERWGLELRRRRILVDRTMRTNRERVFAAGDIADHDGKVSLISIGFGEAALAVNHIAALLDPARSITPGHSSDA
ncbi:putative Ferredoxin--NADP reductase [Streptomyces afghaniensis 772]|uniref:Ferredoxin--NADP reductase n=1 Tax=Streptomyces afghaniensis 772 TaxID=1283301 RepID=S4MFR6_9ACTN|nr:MULTISPECIES: NAD(P)/FAD-dependent oxidoreductase [Streptomyces]EPJ34370.1 putative Ferredoxin--NADP reductase [Streptomyces afghaniensis 772]UOB14831.1 NAD(P)/FAD-dependent oxidoreductase [Streptomyces sp. HP-A2021]